MECGTLNLFRLTPPLRAFTLDSKEPTGGYQEFLMNEARYSRLTREFPTAPVSCSSATRKPPHGSLSAPAEAEGHVQRVRYTISEDRVSYPAVLSLTCAWKTARQRTAAHRRQRG